MKKVLRLILSALLTAAVLCPGFLIPASAKIPSPSQSYYVLDEANELGLSTEEHIVAVNDELERRTGAQVVVVCVKTTGNTEIADYAYQLFNKWDIGSESKHNGVLILLAVQDSNYYALQGKGLENILSSGTLKLMLDDYLEPDFAIGDFDAGVNKMFDAVVKFLSEVYSVTIGEYTTAPVTAQAPEQVETTAVQQEDTDTTFDVEDWLLEFESSVSIDYVFDDSFFSNLFSGIPSNTFSPFRIIKKIFEHITIPRIILIVVVILILRAVLKRKGGGGGSRG